MVLILFSTGSVYCWTLFKEHITQYTNFNNWVVEWCFSLALFFLGMTAAFVAGRIVEKSAKRGALLTFIFFTLGWLLTGIGIHTKNPWLTIIGFGPIQGIGLGFGYLTPVKTLMVWFANRKGMAAGLAITGFGLAGVIANPIIGTLLESVAVYNVFYLLTAIYGVACFIGYKLIYRPEVKEVKNEIEPVPIRELIFTKKFILLWIVFFLNIAGGLALISQEKQIYHAIGINSMNIIVLYCSINAIGNLLGRILMASWQDKLNYKHIPYYLMAVGSLLVCLLAFGIPTLITILIMIFVVQFMFGCGFSCIPNILHQNYGMKQLATVHGLMLSAWAIAGLVGNQFSSFIMLNYNLVTLYFSLAVLYAVQLILFLYWTKNVLRKNGDG